MAVPSGEEQTGSQIRTELEVKEVLTGPPHEGDLGEGLVFRTDQGDLKGILHRAEGSHHGVVWVCGALGGFRGPGLGTYTRLAEAFRGQGITSLRLDYREPNIMKECVVDLLTGIAYLKSMNHAPVVIVGHSFGGAVVIGAGVASDHVKGVVSLAPQMFGAKMVRSLSPTSLLLVHGKADTRLPAFTSEQIYRMAKQPKEVVIYEGAEHSLEECRDELDQLLGDWIPATLAAQPS
jgi:alpha/beta superfamily hydrolase